MTIFLPPFGDWIDAGLEDVPLGPLEQPRVAPLADDVFEDLSTLGLFHHHAFAKLAVYGHGEARKGLSFPEGKIESSLEHAVEIIVKVHRDRGDRELATTFKSIPRSSMRSGTYWDAPHPSMACSITLVPLGIPFRLP
jgi:hypothetical protein